MSESTLTTDEVIDSLTGHDENEIATQFGQTILELISNQTMLRRACVFIVKRREGLNDDDARNFALGMRLGEVLSYFPAESVESGKDESLTEPPPKPSLVGASEPDDLLLSS